MDSSSSMMLVTGGAGFVGSNLAVSFKRTHPSMRIIALDNLKRRGSELNITRLKANGVEFVHGDIRNPEDLECGADADVILECSADPSVLSGYGGSPEYALNTNLVGSVNCFELARRSGAAVVFLSTSRVYPYARINSIKTVETETRLEWSAEQEGDIPGWSRAGIDVGFSLDGPRSLYGATKLCSELILREYIEMYGIRGVINRCGVIAGPWQFGKVDQGVFSLWMLAHCFTRPLRYIGFGGTGKQVRDLLHVEDLFELVDLQLNTIDSISGETYNVGGGVDGSLSLLETTGLCRDITGRKVEIAPDPQPRPADVSVFVVDNRKVSPALKWQPSRGPRKILEDTYRWVKENGDGLWAVLDPDGGSEMS